MATEVGLSGGAADSQAGSAPELAPPSDDEIASIDAWWRAANYLTIGQIYLQANPLLREPLTPEHIKPRLLGHWGTSPGLSFIYAHVSRLIRHTGQQMIYLAGPGHGGPALVAAGYLEGTYSEVYPRRHPGRGRACGGCSASSPSPGGIPSHVSVTTPGSIHEGGELGYVLVHAFGAVMDNPDLHRARGGRRRRGRDRPAGGLVEGHLLPQPGPRRRGAADPAPQRREDLRADRARPQGPGTRSGRCSRATATT